MSHSCIVIKKCIDFSKINDEINQQLERLKWRANEASGFKYADLKDGRFHDGNHGTRWCHIQLSTTIIDEIENIINCSIFRDVIYLWDYKDIKVLPLHIDSYEINYGRVVAGCIPLFGRFQIKTYVDYAKTKPVDTCIYGPGDIFLLNNRRYFHEGLVLDRTRLGVHFFLNFTDFDKDLSLIEMIRRHSKFR